MKQKKLTKSEAGKLGAEKTHENRYKMLEELSKHVPKPLQNFLLTWPTKHLETLLSAYKNGR